MLLVSCNKLLTEDDVKARFAKWNQQKVIKVEELEAAYKRTDGGSTLIFIMECEKTYKESPEKFDRPLPEYIIEQFSE